MKQWRGEEAEAELLCVEEGGKRRALSNLKLHHCGRIRSAGQTAERQSQSESA